MIVAIFFPYIIEYVITTVISEVHIDIWHRNTFWIEKTFEEENILDRIEVSDAGEISDETPRSRSTTRTHNDSIFFCPVHEILHDEKIGCKPCLFDDTELIVHTSTLFLGDDLSFIAFGESYFAEFAKESVCCFSFGQRERREVIFSEMNGEITGVSDDLCVTDSLRKIFEDLSHFFSRTHREIKRHHTQSFFVSDFFIISDAEENILYFCVFFFYIVYVRRSHKRNICFTMYLNESLIGNHLVFIVEIWSEFEIEIPFSKYFFILKSDHLCSFLIAINDFRRYFALE